MLPPTTCTPASTPGYSHSTGARPDILAGSGRLDSPMATTSSVTTNDDHGRGRWGNPDDAEPTPTASSPTGHLPWCHPTACLPGQHIADLGPVPGTGVNTPVRITAICNLDAPVLLISDLPAIAACAFDVAAHADQWTTVAMQCPHLDHQDCQVIGVAIPATARLDEELEALTAATQPATTTHQEMATL